MKIKSNHLLKLIESICVASSKLCDHNGLYVLNPIRKSDGSFNCDTLQKAALSALTIIAGENVEELEDGTPWKMIEV